MHINFCTKMKVKITVAEKVAPPPTATMNRARADVSVDCAHLNINAKAHKARAVGDTQRARLNKEPPPNCTISLHKVKGQEIISGF